MRRHTRNHPTATAGPKSAAASHAQRPGTNGASSTCGPVVTRNRESASTIGTGGGGGGSLTEMVTESARVSRNGDLPGAAGSGFAARAGLPARATTGVAVRARPFATAVRDASHRTCTPTLFAL